MGMQFRLRSLVLLTAIGPPLLAAEWFLLLFLVPILAVLVATFLVGLSVAVSCDRGRL